MTHLDYAKNQLELAEKIVKNSENKTDDVKKMAKELYELCESSVKRCLAHPDLFDVDYDNLEN